MYFQIFQSPWRYWNGISTSYFYSALFYECRVLPNLLKEFSFIYIYFFLRHFLFYYFIFFYVTLCDGGELHFAFMFISVVVVVDC